MNFYELFTRPKELDRYSAAAARSGITFDGDDPSPYGQLPITSGEFAGGIQRRYMDGRREWFDSGGRVRKAFHPTFRSLYTDVVEYYDETGEVHRDGGPAVYSLDGRLECWYQHGDLHRDLGPAYRSSRRQFWCHYGREYSPTSEQLAQYAELQRTEVVDVLPQM